MEKDKNMKQRVFYFDVLNILAIIAVISLHMNGIVHVDPNIRAWNTSLIVECIMYWAVPVFMMISGATLMNYREKYNTKTFFKKRFVKVLVPFIFWAIIMFIWGIVTKKINIYKYYGLIDWLNAFFSNKEQSIYYFMFEILGVYLTMPLLSLLTSEKYRKTLWFIVGLYFIFNGLVPNILKIFDIYWNEAFSIRINGYLIYVILGYLLSTESLGKKERILLYIGALIGIIYRYITTFVLSKKAGYVVKLTWGYFSWHCILLSCAVFIFIKGLNIDTKIKNDRIKKCLATIASCSFGIYLIHMIIKDSMIQFFNWNGYSWTFRTIGIFVVYLISLGIVWILKKIPIVKKIVP